MRQGLLAALFIARKDLRTEFRTKEALNASLSFAIVVLMLFTVVLLSAFPGIATALPDLVMGPLAHPK